MKRLLFLSVLLSVPAVAAEPEYALTIRDHHFEPVELSIPAGVKIKLRVENKDQTPEEFESHDLNREKVIPGNTTVSIFIGPLKSGRYPFIGEFHASTAKGAIVVE